MRRWRAEHPEYLADSRARWLRRLDDFVVRIDHNERTQERARAKYASDGGLMAAKRRARQSTDEYRAKRREYRAKRKLDSAWRAAENARHRARYQLKKNAEGTK